MGEGVHASSAIRFNNKSKLVRRSAGWVVSSTTFCVGPARGLTTAATTQRSIAMSLTHSSAT